MEEAGEGERDPERAAVKFGLRSVLKRNKKKKEF